MKGHKVHYSADELAWLEANQRLVIGEFHSGFVSLFGRHDVTIDNLKSLRFRKGWKTGRTGYFSKGQVPHNRGIPCPPGKGGRHPNARRNQFRKGNEPHNTKFLGHERINKDGYVEISVAETNPHTGYDRRYVHKHVHLWTQVNGPVPEGHALKCVDGNKLNTDPGNWEPVPRAVLLRLNGGSHNRHVAYDTAPAELKPAIMAVARLDYAARRANSRLAASPSEDQ